MFRGLEWGNREFPFLHFVNLVPTLQDRDGAVFSYHNTVAILDGF